MIAFLKLEKKFLFLFKSYFCSWDIQVLEFYDLNFSDVIKSLSIKQEIYVTE